MGVSIEQYRQAIGIWNMRVRRVSVGAAVSFSESGVCTFFIGLVLAVLLVIGSVEKNPGPYSLDDVMEKLDKMNSNIVGIQRVTAELSERLDNLTKELHSVKTENDTLRNLIKQNEVTIDQLENHSRRNNLVFYNLKERGNESWQDTEILLRQFLWEELGINTTDYDFERCHRLGVKRGDHHNRPIIAKLNSFKKKSEILSYAYHSRNTPVSITEDYSRRVRDIRSELKAHLQNAKSAGLRAKLVYDKLYVEGKPYTLSDLKNTDKISFSGPTPGKHEKVHELPTPPAPARQDKVKTTAQTSHPTDEQYHHSLSRSKTYPEAISPAPHNLRPSWSPSSDYSSQNLENLYRLGPEKTRTNVKSKTAD